jgi:hypothetical protein
MVKLKANHSLLITDTLGFQIFFYSHRFDIKSENGFPKSQFEPIFNPSCTTT